MTHWLIPANTKFYDVLSAFAQGSNLSLNALRQHGLNGMLMGARKLDKNPELFTYIKENSP